MKANLVSLCNRELQLDHRSPRNKDREKQGRQRKRARVREKWGREKTGRPGPPGQTIAARWERGSRALPVPKVHSCRPGRAGRSKQPRSSSGVAPSEANFGARALVAMAISETERLYLDLMCNDACLRPSFITTQTEKRKALVYIYRYKDILWKSLMLNASLLCSS